MQTAGATRADPSFDRYARLVRRSLGAPIALVTLIDEDRQLFPGAGGLPPHVDEQRETPISHSFCQYVAAEGAPLVVPDLREDERLRDNPAIADFDVAAYAGWPITDHTGAVVGSLCALDRVPRAWTEADLEMLEDLAAACSTEISERALRSIADHGERAAQDLSHRSRVLLALSEGLSTTRTLADVAHAVEQTALAQLGCLHAGMWLRTPEHPERSGSRGPEHLTYVESPDGGWVSAARNADLPLDDSNPMGVV